MDLSKKRFTLAESVETTAREREIQCLINIVAPDPEYQPFLLTDESRLTHLAVAPEEIRRRLKAHFDLDMELDIRAPIWTLVDEIKRFAPLWPEESPKGRPS